FLLLEAKPQHGPRATPEVRFRTRMFFGMTRRPIAPSRRLLERAIDPRERHAISNLDALHMAAAETGGADRLVTDENARRKPIHHAPLRGTRVLTAEAFLRETR